MTRRDMDALAARMAAPQALPSLDYHFRRHRKEFGATTSAEYFRLFGDHIRRADLRYVSLLRRHDEHRLWYLIAENSAAVAQYDETEGVYWSFFSPQGMTQFLSSGHAWWVEARRTASGWELVEWRR